PTAQQQPYTPLFRTSNVSERPSAQENRDDPQSRMRSASSSASGQEIRDVVSKCHSRNAIPRGIHGPTCLVPGTNKRVRRARPERDRKGTRLKARQQI